MTKGQTTALRDRFLLSRHAAVSRQNRPIVGTRSGKQVPLRTLSSAICLKFLIIFLKATAKPRLGATPLALAPYSSKLSFTRSLAMPAAFSNSDVNTKPAIAESVSFVFEPIGLAPISSNKASASPTFSVSSAF